MPMDLTNKTFGRDRVIEKIADGGMGSVWKTEHVELKVIRALKVMPEGFAGRAELVERFQREAAMMAQLHHPHIVHVHDSGHQDGVYYLVMEYLPGGSLRDRLRQAKGPLEWREALSILDQVCDGLEYAHGKHVIHRDLKPENILFDEQGRAKIADFGLGKILEDVVKTRSGSLLLKKETDQVSLGALPTVQHRPAVSMEGQLLGTLEYMSPEQRTGKEVDQRADIYAIGVICFEMLTGRTPQGILAPSEVSAESPGHLDAFVRRLLSPADRRWETVAGLRGELRRLAGSSVLPAAPATDGRGGRLDTVSTPAEPAAAAQRPAQDHPVDVSAPTGRFSRRIEPFVFDGGQKAYGREQLLSLCSQYPHEGIRYLRTGKLEEWLRYVGEDHIADMATKIRAECPDLRAGLEELITGTRPLIVETGDRVSTPEELLGWLHGHPREGQAALFGCHIGQWLEYRGFTDLSGRAARVIQTGGDQEAGVEEFATGIRPLIFRTGESVTTLEELWTFLRFNSAEARHTLYSGELEQWLKHRGWDQWSELAAEIRRTVADRIVGLKQLLQGEQGYRQQIKAAKTQAAREEQRRLRDRIAACRIHAKQALAAYRRQECINFGALAISAVLGTFGTVMFATGAYAAGIGAMAMCVTSIGMGGYFNRKMESSARLTKTWADRESEASQLLTLAVKQGLDTTGKAGDTIAGHT